MKLKHILLLTINISFSAISSIAQGNPDLSDTVIIVNSNMPAKAFVFSRSLPYSKAVSGSIEVNGSGFAIGYKKVFPNFNLSISGFPVSFNSDRIGANTTLTYEKPFYLRIGKSQRETISFHYGMGLHVAGSHNKTSRNSFCVSSKFCLGLGFLLPARFEISFQGSIYRELYSRLFTTTYYNYLDGSPAVSLTILRYFHGKK